MAFEFVRLEMQEVVLIVPQVFDDDRGFFLESYRWSDFCDHGVPERFVQDNHSRSKRGVLRGLHYQKEPSAQGKLVMVVRGRIFDVAVDIRRGSSTYGRWVGVELSSEDHWLLYVPPGFAHGFCVLSDEADVTYKVTQEFAPDLDRGIRWSDPDIGIRWPLADPILSSRDAGLPLLRDADNSFIYRGDAGR